MRIGVIVAMEKELAQLRTLLHDEVMEHGATREWVTGRIGGNQVAILQCGIGKVNAAIGATELIAGWQPDVIVSSGVAGGADVTLHVGDMVVGTQYVYHDAYCGSECAYGQLQGLPARFEAASSLLGCLAGMDITTPIRQGLIVSGDWFVDSREKMREILSHFPEAMAVDMESCAIAHTCHLYRVPIVSMRIISDVPLSDHKAAQYFDFWDRLADGSFQVLRPLLQSL